jgi:tRNA(fMet)-specific endonuclease VapC
VTRYLVDTNILSDIVKNSDGFSSRRTIELGGSRSVYTSVIVVAELRFGLAKRKAVRLEAQLERVLQEMSVEPFAPPADRIYADLRANLERAGTPIGANDLWIAAQALQDGSVLVTDNVREFGRVPGLTVENWLRP